MLEAGEIVISTLGVAILFFLCCGIMACVMLFDKEKKPSVSRPRLDQALPAVSVQPMYSEKSTETQQPAAEGRRRRDSGTQTVSQNETIIIEEEDLRTESALSAARPQVLQFNRRLQIGAAPAEAVTTQHMTDEFISDLRQIRKSPHSVLSDEFEILRRRAASRWKSTEVAGMNIRRNRYEDVVPYDENRVTLLGGEYINASFIDGYLSSQQFIATQWPISQEEIPGKEATSEHFWKMIWEYRVQAVVSLSGINDVLPPFWPPLRGVRKFGEITIEQDRSHEEAGCLVRLFSLLRMEERRRVHQFHLADWEDGDIPEEEKVLFLAQKIKDYPKPVVVHCSAGVGRTGVFIAVCRLLSQANQRGLIDVFSVVDSMRQQRIGMVRTKEQYENIYDILRLAVESHQIVRSSRI